MAYGVKYPITGNFESTAFGRCKFIKDGDPNWSAEADFMDNQYHGLGMCSEFKI